MSPHDGYTFALIRSGLEVTMPDIFHDLPIKVSPDRVLNAISTPQGLDAWWTKKSSGRPAEGEEYELWFGPQYNWRALVTKCVAYGIRTPNSERQPRLEWYACGLSSSRWANNERAFPSHRLALGQRALADLVLLLGDVSAGAASARPRIPQVRNES
jgi:hypothetical protein